MAANPEEDSCPYFSSISLLLSKNKTYLALKCEDCSKIR